VPGGRVEPGESLQEAARREVREETGLDVAVGRELGVVDREYVDAAGRARVLEIHDFDATVVGGELTAGDDAVEVRWMSLRDLEAAPLTPDLIEILASFGVVLG
jgi:acetyl-CoA carboxylase carboxyl transferase subunit beta